MNLECLHNISKYEYIKEEWMKEYVKNDIEFNKQIINDKLYAVYCEFLQDIDKKMNLIFQ